ncbi:MAG: PrgI family mobile element protein [Mycobacteriales bacterium]
MNSHTEQQFQTVRIPADVGRPDRIVFGLTGHQLAVLTPVTVLLYLAYLAARPWVPLPVLLATLSVLGMVALAAVLAERDGVSLDRLAVAALRYRRTPRVRVPAPGGLHPAPSWVRVMAMPSQPSGPAGPAGLELAAMSLPARGVDTDGVLDLGADGYAALGAVSTVNFGLRSPAEQQQLVGGFARWLHSLTGKVQILIRSQRLDLTEAIMALEQHATTLPHPALEQAALEHAQFLAELTAERDLHTRQVLLIAHEPTPKTQRLNHTGEKARTRVALEIEQAARGLAGAELTVRPLDGEQATGVLAAAFNPHADSPPAPGGPPGAAVTARGSSNPEEFTGGDW